MKKLSFLFLMLFLALINLSAQDIVFTFNAKDDSNTIDSIKATKVETGETVFVEGSNTINLSSFTTGTKILPTNTEKISIYPNPFENYTQLMFSSNQNDNIKVSIVNAAGQVVAEKSQNITPGIHQFNISTNNNGLYILNVTGNQTKISQKIISSNNSRSLNKIEYNGYSSLASKEKSAKTEGDEIIHFIVYSGDNITKIADSPTESKTYEVEFYDCKDADGKSYPIVQIGDQWWMAENLVYNAGDGCWAYNNEESNIKDYGRLYTWETANDVCPEGWHLPTDAEWEQLVLFINDQKGPYVRFDEYWWENVGVHLKSTFRWNDSENGTDDFGFTGFPGGLRDDEGNFYSQGSDGQWWSATSKSSTEAYDRLLVNYVPRFFRNYHNKDFGSSVRCVKDSLGILELNDQECPNSGAVMAQIEGIGIVKVSPSTGINYIDYYEYSDGGSFSANLYPCNISNEQLTVGAKIEFSGIVYSKDDPDDSTIDSNFTQIVISSAEYVE